MLPDTYIKRTSDKSKKNLKYKARNLAEISKFKIYFHRKLQS